MDRTEKIRERLEGLREFAAQDPAAWQWNGPSADIEAALHQESVQFLLSRIDELERENEKRGEACRACLSVVGVVADGSATQRALKKLKAAGYEW